METVITAQELLEIHKIACIEWKRTIRLCYLPRINEDQTVHFSQDEINDMFNAATALQKPVLKKIFGKQVNPIEWDRIKTGSKVMIQCIGEYYSGLGHIDASRPVDVVFYRNQNFIDPSFLKFLKEDVLSCTFHQDSKYIVFKAHETTDYITEVIEY